MRQRLELSKHNLLLGLSPGHDGVQVLNGKGNIFDAISVIGQVLSHLQSDGVIGLITGSTRSRPSRLLKYNYDTLTQI